MRDTADRFITGFIGTASPLAAAALSLQNIEATLRIVSLIVGIAVAIGSRTTIEPGVKLDLSHKDMDEAEDFARLDDRLHGLPAQEAA